MATKHHPEHHSEPLLESPMDYAQHEKTYEGFLTVTKWTVIILAASMVILFFLIQP